MTTWYLLGTEVATSRVRMRLPYLLLGLFNKISRKNSQQRCCVRESMSLGRRLKT